MEINLLINRIFFTNQQGKGIAMLLSTFHLFSDISCQLTPLIQELERPILRNIFTVNNTEVILTLTNNYIVLHNQQYNQTPTHYCPLTFQVKFQTIYESTPNQTSLGLPTAIKLEREGCPEQLTFQACHPSIVERWSIELEKRINQRNFYKLFKAKKKIGKGAFATVYLAERLRDHKMVAVKAFSKQKQYSGAKGRQSLQNQIKIMRKLNHTNIMKLEGVYQTQNSIYVILEYLQGQQLNELLKNNKMLEAHEIKLILESILKGLAHLSSNLIIHRDIKPENILFKKSTSYEVAICDFGLATLADEDKYLFVRCGTPGFVAPEIINIKDMSAKSQPISDVFSAGIIFHYLLFGCSVFQGKKYNQILSQNRQCLFNFQKQIYSKINPRAFDLLTKMLEKDPTKRITAQSALSHPYFMSNMDIEFEDKTLYKNSSFSGFSLKKELQEELRLSSKKREQKPFFFNNNKREEGAYLCQ